MYGFAAEGAGAGGASSYERAGGDGFGGGNDVEGSTNGACGAVSGGGTGPAGTAGGGAQRDGSWVSRPQDVQATTAPSGASSRAPQ